MAAVDESVAARRSTASETGDAPVRDDELDALFSSLLTFRLLVLAVSGGADSMALMLLARRWIERCEGAPKFVVASVDHGLRAEARAEAEWVVSEARGMGLEAALLTWSGDKPVTGIQDAARAARYNLLAGFARAAGEGPAAIVTAHTEDDQAETLLMRLARGSGLDGLAAMASLRVADEEAPRVMLTRPLLGISGARLKATLRAAGRTWIEDPSNDAERFERVRVRRARGALAEIGLSNEKIALSVRRLARAREALDAAVDALQHDAQLDVHAGAYASFDAATWRAAAEEVRLRLLGRLIAAFGGRAEPLRLIQLEALVTRMSGPQFEGATLAGAEISVHGKAIHVLRELGREPLERVVLVPGETAVWDHRFRVGSSGESPGAVEVGALGGRGYADLRQELRLDPGVPAKAAATLPAFWCDGRLLFVPQLASLHRSWASGGGEQRLYSAEFIV